MVTPCRLLEHTPCLQFYAIQIEVLLLCPDNAHLYVAVRSDRWSTCGLFTTNILIGADDWTSAAGRVVRAGKLSWPLQLSMMIWAQRISRLGNPLACHLDRIEGRIAAATV